MEGGLVHRLNREMDRRKFLEVGGKTLVGGLLGTGFLSHAEAQTGSSSLPPGIASSRDEYIKILWADWHGAKRIDNPGRRLKLGSSFPQRVMRDSLYLEPAAYMLAMKMTAFTMGPGEFDTVLEVAPKDLQQKSRHLYEFVEGMDGYHGLWMGRRYRRLPNLSGGVIEKHFLTSLYLCANSGLNEDLIAQAQNNADAFMAASTPEKAMKADELMRTYRQIGTGNPSSKDPFDPFNRLLTAAASSAWLANHYWSLPPEQGDGPMEIINRRIEIPLRELGFPMRGEAKYIDDKV